MSLQQEITDAFTEVGTNVKSLQLQVSDILGRLDVLEAGGGSGNGFDITSLPALPLPAYRPTGTIAPGTPFSIAAAGTAAAAAPIISEWTRAAGANDYLLLTGEALSSSNSFKVFANGEVRDVPVSAMDAQKGVAKFPTNLGAWGFSVFWAKNANGYSSPVTVNQAEAWWMMKTTAPGQTKVPIHGRNLANGNGDGVNNSNVYIKHRTSGAAGIYCAVTEVTPYRVLFTLPSNLPLGEYDVWAHNGSGGDWGWSEPLQMTVINAEVHILTAQYLAGTIDASQAPYNVIANNSGIDNAPRINAALTDANNQDKIVLLPSSLAHPGWILPAIR